MRLNLTAWTLGIASSSPKTKSFLFDSTCWISATQAAPLAPLASTKNCTSPSSAIFSLAANIHRKRKDMGATHLDRSSRTVLLLGAVIRNAKFAGASLLLPSCLSEAEFSIDCVLQVAERVRLRRVGFAPDAGHCCLFRKSQAQLLHDEARSCGAGGGSLSSVMSTDTE